ncbi:MAG: hypothetical protein FWD19_01200 [Defluviitaleaceae bacterium]|nr:hypothetical protein [Defluviitaleaceae bacterium]
MKYRFIVCLAFFVFFTAVLSGCSSNEYGFYYKPAELSVIYETDGQKTIEVPRLTAEQAGNVPVKVSASYVEFTEDRLFDSSLNEFFAVGKISNIRELRTEYVEYEQSRIGYGTLFDLKVEKVFFIADIDRQINPGDVITIYSAHSSYKRDFNFAPLLHEGDEFFLTLIRSATLAAQWYPYDVSAISEFVVSSSTHGFIRKNGDYYETWIPMFHEKEYDGQAISKAEAFGIDESNYLEAGYFFGLENLSPYPYYDADPIIPAKVAVMKGDNFRELAYEYIEDNPELGLSINTLPDDVEQMLLEEAIKIYSIPDLLSGDYDYEKGLRDELAHNGGYHASSTHRELFYLFRVDSFENTIRQKINQLR